MDWRDIPSLAALRAFEAVARAGSFSAAARELNVTHAAIAQHVRAIEADLKTSLLVREGRGMALTDAGTVLAAALSGGFSQIINGVNAITADAEARPVALSVTPSFAENWLMPRYADFWAKHPDVGLSIMPSMQVLDLRREGIDMAVRYGKGEWPGMDVIPLVKADFTVVGAPSLIAGRDVSGFADLEGLPWIFENVHREARRWVSLSGVDLNSNLINVVPTIGMVMSAVRSGKYLTVASSTMVADDIKAGLLVPLIKKNLKDVGYYIVYPKGVLSPRAKTVKSWLLSAV